MTRQWNNSYPFLRNAPDGNPGALAPTDSSGNGNPSSDTSAIDSLWASFSGVSEVVPDVASAGAGNTQQTPQSSEQQQVGNNQQTVTPPTSPATAAPMAPPTAVPPDQSAAQIAELRGQLNALMQMGANNQQQQAAPQQQQPRMPDFRVQIPNEVVQALRSEDPIQTQQALEYLGNNLGSMVLHRAQQDLGALYQHISQAIPQMVASMIAQHTQMSRWHDDFYKDYSELGVSPQMKQLVANTAAQLAQQGKVTSLDKASGRMVAEAVLQAMGCPPQMIQQFFARKSGQPIVASQQQIHPAIANSMARPMNNGNPLDPNSMNAISDLISGGF